MRQRCRVVVLFQKWPRPQHKEAPPLPPRCSIDGSASGLSPRTSPPRETPPPLYTGTSLKRKRPPHGPYSRPMSMVQRLSLKGGAVSHERDTPVAAGQSAERSYCLPHGYLTPCSLVGCTDLVGPPPPTRQSLCGTPPRTPRANLRTDLEPIWSLAHTGVRRGHAPSQFAKGAKRTPATGVPRS